MGIRHPCGARYVLWKWSGKKVSHDTQGAGFSRLRCDRDADGHRPLDGDGLDVLTLDRVWLQVLDMINECLDVLDKFFFVEVHLADNGVDDARCVVAEFDLTGLVFFDRAGNFGRDSAGTWRRHQPAGAEHFAERTDQTHHVGCGDTDIELGPAFFDLLAQVISTDFVGTSSAGLVSQFALGEYDNALGLADAVRQDNRAADQLVGLLGIDAKTHGDFHGLHKLWGWQGFQHLDRFGQRNRALGRALVAIALLRFETIGIGKLSFNLVRAARDESRDSRGVPENKYKRLGRSLALPTEILTFDDQAHTAGGPFDHAARVFNVAGIKISHLELDDLGDLFLVDFANLVLIWDA